MARSLSHHPQGLASCSAGLGQWTLDAGTSGRWLSWRRRGPEGRGEGREEKCALKMQNTDFFQNLNKGEVTCCDLGLPSRQAAVSLHELLSMFFSRQVQLLNRVMVIADVSSVTCC